MYKATNGVQSNERAEDGRVAQPTMSVPLYFVTRNDPPGARLLPGENTVAQLPEEARWQHSVIVPAVSP